VDEGFPPITCSEVSGESSPRTPVQFCTSPPVDVHRPRQHSASPPAKLFLLSDKAEIGIGIGSQKIYKSDTGGISRKNSFFIQGASKSENLLDFKGTGLINLNSWARVLIELFTKEMAH
jgi:hypothetical protein